MKPAFHTKATIFLFSLCLMGSPLAGPFTQTATAQSSAMMQMARGELDKRGLTESEVRTRLLEKGIDVDNIPPAEYPAYQSRVTAVLNELEAEKKGRGTGAQSQGTSQPVVVNVATPTTTPVAGNTPTNNTTTQAGVTTPADLPETTPEEAAAEASQRVAQAAAANRGGAYN